jgi:hypothetical protein
VRPTKDPHTRAAIHTLERLQAELGGQILANKQEAERLGESMRHVEAVIKMLDPAYCLRVSRFCKTIAGKALSRPTERFQRAGKLPVNSRFPANSALWTLKWPK